MKEIKTTLDITLWKKKRIKIGKRRNQIVLAAEWVDTELTDNISLRSKLSMRWRIARKNKEPEETLRRCKEEYEKQQIKTSIMSCKKKGEWEVKKVKETWKDGKKFWTMIKELLGNNKEKDEDTYVYTEEGLKKDIIEISEEYLDKRKQNIYQKTGRIDFTFWYGDENQRGMKEEMEEDERNENSEIMKFPIIQEEELMTVIKNMKNGESAGIDGVSAELMKHITKNEEIS